MGNFLKENKFLLGGCLLALGVLWFCGAFESCNSQAEVATVEAVPGTESTVAVPAITTVGEAAVASPQKITTTTSGNGTPVPNVDSKPGLNTADTADVPVKINVQPVNETGSSEVINQ